MVTRRTTAPRKRTVSGPAGSGIGAAIEAAPQQAGHSSNATESEELKSKVVGAFEAELRNQSGLDEEGLEFILDNFKQTVANAQLEAAPTLPDVDTWARTLDELAEAGAISEDDRRDLALKFEQAFATLQSDNVQVALEYARRLEADGEESALAWLKEARALPAESQSDESADAPPATPASQLRQSVTQSKSRRLRGPPQT